MTKLLRAYLLCFAAVAQIPPPTVATQTDSSGHAVLTVHNNSADQGLIALVYTITLVDPVSGKTRATCTRFVDSQTNAKTKAIPPNGDATFTGGGSANVQAQLAFDCAVFEDGSTVGDGACVKRLLDRRSVQRNIIQAILTVVNDPVLTATSPAKIVAAVNAARAALLPGLTDPEQIGYIDGVANMIGQNFKPFLANPDMSSADAQGMIKALQADFTTRAKLLAQ